MKSVATAEAVDSEYFHAQIWTADEPTPIKGQVRSWPIVVAPRRWHPRSRGGRPTACLLMRCGTRDIGKVPLH